MTIKELAFKIEDLHVESEKVHGMSEVIFQAIYRGDFAPETYEWAFVAFTSMTFELQEQMKALTNESFKLMRGEKES